MLSGSIVFFFWYSSSSLLVPKLKLICWDVCSQLSTSVVNRTAPTESLRWGAFFRATDSLNSKPEYLACSKTYCAVVLVYTTGQIVDPRMQSVDDETQLWSVDIQCPSDSRNEGKYSQCSRRLAKLGRPQVVVCRCKIIATDHRIIWIFVLSLEMFWETIMMYLHIQSYRIWQD